MLAENRQLESHWAKVAGGDIAKGDDVAQGFTHLAAIDLDVIIVQPNLRKLLPSQTLALSNLIGVMYRNVVNAASVNINTIAQRLPGDCRTL